MESEGGVGGLRQFREKSFPAPRRPRLPGTAPSSPATISPKVRAWAVEPGFQLRLAARSQSAQRREGGVELLGEVRQSPTSPPRRFPAGADGRACPAPPRGRVRPGRRKIPPPGPSAARRSRTAGKAAPPPRKTPGKNPDGRARPPNRTNRRKARTGSAAPIRPARELARLEPPESSISTFQRNNSARTRSARPRSGVTSAAVGPGSPAPRAGYRNGQRLLALVRTPRSR